VFCNFNANYKLTPQVFASWMRILEQTDNSVLWLLEGVPEFRAHIRREAARHGIAEHRLVFAGRLPAEDHLARIKLADLFLDTLPCNAHTTASDALWAGLPLLTCRGTAFCGRVAASLLSAMGAPELICESMDDYERLAVTLARDPATLKSIREKLARNRLKAPLFDTAAYTRHLEQAYARMWDIHRRGEAPRSFTVGKSPTARTRTGHRNPA
jgi:predicted O-linked N-acetylglucosamine transferase (SPINDLY family)